MDCNQDQSEWDFTESAPMRFRNNVWRILGQSRKRDVFLAVRELASERAPLEQVEIASKLLDYPHFATHESAPDLSDNGDLDPLKEVLALVAVPKVSRPTFEYVVPFEPMCQYLVNPFHAPTNEQVEAAIEYFGTNLCEGVRELDRGGTDSLPIDPTSAEAYTYVSLVDAISGNDPKVRFDVFRPNDFGARTGVGFEICGSISVEDLQKESGVTDSSLKHALGDIFTEFVEHAARGKELFRIGMYEEDDDECDRDARLRAIADYATFRTFDPDIDHDFITFEWEVEPIIL